jgi:nicotinate-nucleotide pyrophosphorylase (carboxylating)
MRRNDISSEKEVLDLIDRALKEDIGSGDATTLALVPSNVSARASIISRGNYTISVTTVAKNVFKHIDSTLKCSIVKSDGNKVSKGIIIMRITGKVRSILAAERTALNFLQRMTGIATLTSVFVAKIKPYNVDILDTRKTTPTLRRLEKYAVLCGGGCNHRMGLYDRILIKDNHRKLWSINDSHGLGAAVQEARRKYPGLRIEVEVESLGDLKNVLKSEPDWILLDNMSVRHMKKCVAECSGKCLLEASGGINLGNVKAVAKTGINAISLGCLTHSAPAADLTLEID